MSFDHIDMLQQFNINATDITKLRNGGISTVMAVLQVTRRQLLKIKAFLLNYTFTVYTHTSIGFIRG